MKTVLKKTSRNLILLGFIYIFLLIIIVIIINGQFEQSSINLRKNELKHLVTVGVNSIETFRKEYINGETDREEALRRVTNQIRLFTYMDELQPNYLFMSSYDGIMLVQPYQPEMEGSNQIDLKDAEGKFIIRELIAQAQTEPGWVTYKYYPPDSDIAYKKISYVVGLPELGCYIGTGMYSTDIQQIIKKHLRQTLISLIVVIAVLLISGVVIIYPIIFSIQIIALRLGEIGDGPLLDAPKIDTGRFNPNSDAAKLLEKFHEIIKRLAARNQSLIATAEERDRLKTEHIRNTEMLMKEMNHRIKNNLQIIISLLQIELSQTENEIIRHSHLETISRLESISIIHSMLYSNDNYSSIPGKRYLQDLVSYIIHSFGAENRIKIDFRIDDTVFTIDQAVTIGIITNEAITNSVKYAFEPGTEGLISISLSSQEDQHIYNIYDNGSGIPEENLKDIDSNLGISLINNLSRQLGGRLLINTVNGTNYRITF